MSIFDLNTGEKPKGGNASEKFSKIIDDSMMAVDQQKVRRKYLGASRWGHHCDRALAYEFHGLAKDEGKGFKGKTLRIFDMGHDGEERMAEYLKTAGFAITTHGPDGNQIGFSLNDGMLKGHVDGIIYNGPDMGLAWPALWENKALGDSSFSKVSKNGIKEANNTYFVQAQVYMTYTNTKWCLFTCINRDTGEVYAEIIMSDSAVALSARDRAVRIISSEKPEEMPRCTTDMNDRRCKWCDYSARCWANERKQIFNKDEEPKRDWLAEGWSKQILKD